MLNNCRPTSARAKPVISTAAIQKRYWLLTPEEPRVAAVVEHEDRGEQQHPVVIPRDRRQQHSRARAPPTSEALSSRSRVRAPGAREREREEKHAGQDNVDDQDRALGLVNEVAVPRTEEAVERREQRLIVAAGGKAAVREPPEIPHQLSESSVP